jgi:hypothetical protein
VKFSSRVDPQNIQIPVSKDLQDIRNEKLLLGMAWSNTQSRIYPAFFRKKESFSDSIMITSSGLMTVNPNTGDLRVSIPENLRNPGEADNSLVLNVEQCVFRNTGRINLNLASGALKMETFGTLEHFIFPDSTSVRAAIAFNYPFPESASEKLSLQLQAVNLAGITISGTPYNAAVKNLMNPKEYDKVKSETEMLGKFRKLPDELIRTLFLADIRLRWDSVNKSWISYGPIGIGNIGKTQVNRYVNGIVEFMKKKNGDDFTIYFELTKNDWYFFNYRNNLLQVLSSNLEFNDMITEALKSKSESKRVDDLAKGFRYTLSNERKKRDFLRKFEKEE